MFALAAALVITSAFIHASWNLLAKRAAGGISFVLLITFLAAIFYAVPAFLSYRERQPQLGPAEFFIIAVSAVLQLAYFVSLQRGYRTGEFSVVYPLARGSGPMIATLAAIVLFGERPGLTGLLGVALIGLGVVILTGGIAGLRSVGDRSAIVFGLLTGVIIACYTLWDKRAVSQFNLPPIFYDWSNTALRALLLLPVAVRLKPQLKEEWRIHRREAVGVAILSPLAYILVLTALTFAPVYYVAPAREISILIGTFMGTRLLGEKDARRKLTGAAVMVAGVIALTLG